MNEIEHQSILHLFIETILPLPILPIFMPSIVLKIFILSSLFDTIIAVLFPEIKLLCINPLLLLRSSIFLQSSYSSNIFNVYSKKSKTFIFVGGTGLYFNALLNGLSQIPQIPEEIRDFANSCDLSFFLEGLNINDPSILEKIDTNNRRRVQRAWEVLEATGKSILYWQSKNTSPLISASNATLLLVELEKEGLANRISNRVNHMLECGVIKEVEQVYNTCWDKKLPFTKAIGAEDIVRYLNGEISFEKLFQNLALKTRQFAKRQRTWQRNYMKDWSPINTLELNRLDIKKIVKKVKANN